MKRKSIIISTIFISAMTLAACLLEPTPTAENNVTSTASDKTCTEKGGRLITGPLSQQSTCVLPTADAGKSCVSSVDCSTHCLADTMTCAPETPYFGCFDEAMGNGRKATLCVE